MTLTARPKLLQPNKYDSDLAESAVASKSHQR